MLVNKDGALIAYNTDGQGCVAYLERAGVDFRGTSVVVCGTGPTSLSILHAVAQAGPDEVILIGRDKAKARNVMRTYADELGAMVGRVVDMPRLQGRAPELFRGVQAGGLQVRQLRHVAGRPSRARTSSSTPRRSA